MSALTGSENFCICFTVWILCSTLSLGSEHEILISRNAASLMDGVRIADPTLAGTCDRCRRFNAQESKTFGCGCGYGRIFDEKTMSCVYNHLFRRRESRSHGLSKVCL